MSSKQYGPSEPRGTEDTQGAPGSERGAGTPGAPGSVDTCGRRGPEQPPKQLSEPPEERDADAGLSRAPGTRSGADSGSGSGPGGVFGSGSGSGEEFGVASGAVSGGDSRPVVGEGAAGGGAPGVGRGGRGGHGSGAGGDDGPGDGSGAGTGTGTGPGFGDEQDLRALLRSAVRDLEPAPSSLEHLRHAVPARRRRRRHAMVGAAAALLFGGTSIPAMLHIANGGDDPAHPANAASSSEAHATTGGSSGGPTRQQDGGPAGKDGEKKDKDGKKNGKDEGETEKGADQASGGAVADPPETMDVTSPACSRDQLGDGSSALAAADAEGRVYGTLRVVNVSAATCSVDGGGTVVAVAQGGADQSRIQVVDHTAGDAATGLPDPSTVPDQIVLKPGEAYVVKFAWIPAAGGGTSGCAVTGTPTPGSSQGPGEQPSNTAAAEGGADQTEGTGGTGDGGTQASSVAVSHTPEAGEPSAVGTTVNDACAGTVYRTGALAGQ